jgi:hypothetical protein
MKLIIYILMLLQPSLVFAESSDDRKRIQFMKKELKELYQAGKSLHTQFGRQDVSGLQACADKSVPLRSRADKVKKMVSAVDPMFRYELTIASDAAFQCVYCGNDGRVCSEIPSALKNLDEQVRKSRAPDRAMTAKEKW